MYKMKHDGDVETCTESDSYNLIYDLVDVSFGFWSFVPSHVHALALQCNDNKIKVYSHLSSPNFYGDLPLFSLSNVVKHCSSNR